MKCKDCVCSDVCYYKAFNDVRAVKKRDDVEKVCKSFVNRDAVEVVHGRWEVSRESEISRNVWCTACGKDFYMHRKGELQIDKMPYCPNCGADMRERKDNESI